MAVSKKKKLKIYAALVFLALFAGIMAFLFSGDSIEILKEVFKEDVTKEEVRAALEKFGVKGYVTIGLLSMLQVLFPFVPAEPVQVVAGMSFGFVRGSLICLLGLVVGCSIVYVLYKIYGDKLTDYFETNAEFDFDAARRSVKVVLVVLILSVLPAIPYGVICLFAASLNLKYPRYVFLMALGSLPSIFVDVGLGEVALGTSWVVSIIVFVVLVVLLVLMLRFKKKIFKLVNEFMKKQEKNAALQRGSRLTWATLAFGSKIVYDGKIKLRVKRHVKKLERPAIVLCNHGSFIDFVFAGRILRKERPHFVAARLYTYHKTLGKIMRGMGCLPKSMFTVDLENAKSCVRMLANGEVLALLPEARLSTVGKFEGVQASTYRFIQRSGVPVYALRMHGSYFAKPKWGVSTRRGAVVEAELSPLFEKGETKTLSLEEIASRVENAIGYNEWDWLENRPKIRYKDKRLAEGLENILYLCPKCGAKYAGFAKGKTLYCGVCGAQTTIDERYAFEKGAPFENLEKWYAWQTQEMAKELAQNPDFKLESKVELRHSSVDGKSFTRHAGEGVCTLDRTGLRYVGTRDGKQEEKFFPIEQIYRLLFGAGEDFEIYEGKEIWYFVPENRRSAVAWYIASGLLKAERGEE